MFIYLVYNTYVVKVNCFYKPGISFVYDYVILKVCLHFKNRLEYIYPSLIGIKY